MNMVDLVRKPAFSNLLQDVPFAKAKVGQFFQDKSKLHNPYTTDGPLKRYLKRLLPPEIFAPVETDLLHFGDRIVSEIDDIGRECELNPPYLRPYDAWGRRVDKIVTAAPWKRMKAISAEEGLVAIGYENRFNEFDRIYQYAKMYLFAPSSGLYSCPLAASDGAARVLKDICSNDSRLKAAFSRLTSRNPEVVWTSGQWMTEKRGGSDVANGTETVAYPRTDGLFNLYGYKWFSSTTDSEMSLTLARTASTTQAPLAGTKGLSLFFVQARDPVTTNQLNNIEIVRMKDKLGTRQLPTAELLLAGAVAQKISDDGRGVASISDMLNVTRIHNAISGVGYMRRILSLSRDYTFQRRAFGKYLIEHPLHVQTLARMEIETRGNLILLLEVAKLLGLQEKKKISKDQNLILRLLTPLLKLYNGKMAVPLVSEGLESFGGMGYLEDTGLPTILRDAQILPIWEGTTNILSLDVLRHLTKEGEQVLSAYKNDIESKISECFRSVTLEKSAKITSEIVKTLVEFAVSNTPKLEVAARDFAISLARCYIGALLLEHACSSFSTKDDVETAIRWCQKKFMLLLEKEQNYGSDASAMDKTLILDGYPNEKAKL